MSLVKFEKMLKTNNIYFFDLVEFEEIIVHYLDVGKHALAKKAVKLGLEQHPQSVDLKLLQVELYIFENELEKASTLLKIIENLEPNNDEVFIQKATISSKLGNHKEAISNLKIALTFTQDKVDVWSLLGMEYLYLDDYDNARLNFAKCIAVDYEDYSALYNVVYCFDMENKHEAAIHYLNEYIEKNPYCEVAWHQLGRQYFMEERFGEALRAFDYAVLIDESFIGGYLEKAKTLEQLGSYKDAIENYKVTLELDDPTAFAYVRIGKCYEKLQQLDEAIYHYKKAVHEDPLLDSAWMLLTNLYFDQKQYQKASYYILKAIQIDEDNALYWRKYAEIQLKLNFFEEAITGLKKCLSLEDNALEVYIGLADVLLFIGDFTAALATVLSAKEIYNELAEIEYRLAGLHYILDKKAHAIQCFTKALELDFEYHVILSELFPTVFETIEVQKLIASYKKTHQ